MPTRFNITPDMEWHVGADKTIAITVTDGNGAAQALTGLDTTWELLNGSGSPVAEALISKTSGASQIAYSNGSGTDDVATITIDAADTASLTPGIYHHRLRLTSSGSVDVLSFGHAYLRPGIA